jgi:ribosomal protein L40E
MPLPDRKAAEPAGPPAESAPSPGTPAPPAAPGVMTALICERCGNENLIRVKGCWYCEKCHYKFDCYGF